MIDGSRARGFPVKIVVLSVFLAVSLLFCTDTYGKDEQKICQVEAVDYPGKDPTMWYGLYAAKSGMVYSALITEGGSSHIYKYDP